MTRYEGREVVDALPDESLVAVAYGPNGEVVGFDDCDDFNAWWCEVANNNDQWMTIEGLGACDDPGCPE